MPLAFTCSTQVGILIEQGRMFFFFQSCYCHFILRKNMAQMTENVHSV